MLYMRLNIKELELPATRGAVNDSRSPFLRAIWSNLLLVTYEVPPEVLTSRLAEGIELDTLDGKAFVSLVAFDFLETKVMGVKWPGFVHFPEINLRFYVRETATGRRGVMFIKELVPSSIIAWFARTLYNEPYAATPMRSSVAKNAEGDNVISHNWSWRGREHSLELTSTAEAKLPPEESTEHFFKEHQWGFGKTRAGKPLVYEVRHPHWKVFDVLNLDLNVDLAQQYGEEFEFLNTSKPYSVVHALGSDIEVFPHTSR